MRPALLHSLERRLLPLACLLISAALNASAQEATRADNFNDVLRQAQAKTAAKEWTAAAALWEKVVESNPVEGEFWYQLANARYNAKDYRKAIPAYERALAVRAHLPTNLAYNIACCYALAGDKEQALKWLERALDMGFSDLGHAQTDTDFQSLRDDPRFQRLVALVDTSKMSREEGWRYDLQVVAREVKRKGYMDGVARKLSKEDFDAAVKRLSEQIPKLTDMQVSIELMKLLRLVGDGHTGVLAAPPRPEYIRSVPVQFYLFKEGLFIIGADPSHKDLLGMQVLRFGERTIDEVMAALDPLTSRDNEIWPSLVGPYRMRYLPLLHGLGLIPDPARVTLTLRDAEGKTRNLTLAADMSAPDIWNVFPKTWLSYPQTLTKPLPLYLKNTSARYWFEHLPESKTVYFQYNRVRNDQQEPLAQFNERLFKFINDNDVDKLVIDLRWNNGGNTPLSQPLLHSLIRNERVNRRGHLFVIIGRRTFSAAQNTATFIERHTNAIFVGEPTGSSPNFIGEENPFTLPYSKMVANVSDLFWQSAWPMDYRTWIAPQIYTPPTFEYFRANRDPAMEAILAYR